MYPRRSVGRRTFCPFARTLGAEDWISLWESSLKPKLSTFALPQPTRPLEAPPQAEAGPSRASTPAAQMVEAVQKLDVADEANLTSGNPVGQLDASEISTLLSVALLQALSSLDRALFPMPASLLYSAHILPNRPAYIPREQRQDVVIAKSEWKKLAKWMKEASKEGLLKTKEVKGEIVVQR